MAKIPMSYNRIDEEGLHKVLQRYRNANHQQLVTDFENEVKLKSGAKQVVALNSGTAALHLALKVLGVGHGDYVIVSTFTYIASVSPIVYCGARPVFIDSEEITWNMDPDLLEQALADFATLGKQVKAIVVVHTYGMPAQMGKILPITRKYNVPVVEDAAESFGATIDGRWTGTLGDIGIYSFNSNKSVTTFGGGALVTDRTEWALKARKLSTHAREDKPYYEHQEMGHNYAMSPLNAAYGLLELSRCGEQIANRRKQYEAYAEKLGDRVLYQLERPGMVSSRWLTTVRISSSVPSIIDQLVDSQDYEIRRAWKPMHQQAVFGEEKAYLNGVSDALFGSTICLTSGNLKALEFDKICDWLLNIIE